MCDMRSTPSTTLAGARDRSGSGSFSTSLVSYRQTVAETVAECPRPGYLFRNVETGALAPVPCNRNACESCGRRKALTRALAAQWVGKPSKLLTLTLVGDSIEVIRSRVKRFRYRVKEAGHDLEMWWVVEANPRGTGHHVHALARAEFIPQSLLSDIADREGMGFRVDIRALEQNEVAAPYLVKEVAAAYLVKGREDIERFLRINGGRYGHHTRGYFGMPVKEADRLAQGRADREGHEPGQWELVRLEEAIRRGMREIDRDEPLGTAESILARYGVGLEVGGAPS